MRTTKLNNEKNSIRRLLSWLRLVLILAGGFLFIAIILSFTPIPYRLYHSLGTRLISKISQPPQAIVLLGAGGMPGAESLLRIHYTAILAERYPKSRVVVALPADTAAFNQSDHYRMLSELRERGVAENRMLSEKLGTNTHEQSIQLSYLLNKTEDQLVIVTSPEHMYRAIKCFRKAGFANVNGLPTFENAFEEQLLLQSRGKKKPVKGVDQNLDLRYNMWSYLQYEIRVLREYTAITYYMLMGYI